MARLLNAAGISAQDYSGDTKHPEKVMQEFKEHKIRFLCACDMISEGWDYPETRNPRYGAPNAVEGAVSSTDRQRFAPDIHQEKWTCSSLMW